MFKKTIPHRTSGPRAAAMLCASVVALAGCGEDADNVQYGTPQPAPPEEAREASHEGMGDADYGGLDRNDVGLHIPWTQNLITRDPVPDAPTARLTDVAAEALEGFDRVIFTFESRTAGYELRMVEQGGAGCDGTEPGTDAPAHMAIEFPRTVSHEGGTPLVAARSLALDFPTLLSAAQTCDEGERVRWLLGTSGEVTYRLLEVRNGNQIVVDLRGAEADTSAAVAEPS